ncbi:chemokine (C-C motif) receptor 12a [Periophthalmus magnuspinnatus]|uniref:chemokine (C-C motif) receptor 12a n=1 Tax=Periophthalmus magnuspinnatus TaxID=409849 RepID=UPI00145AA5C3|nr:chemokine (C-C motif) receptor 12a [Periophthalmus magnuspinnatus]
MDDIMDEDLWYLFEAYNNSMNTTDPTYVVSHTVKLCSKSKVNIFGAKLIPIFYFTTFILGCLGNGLVLAILFKYEKLQNVTNIFLLNLVLSNLIFASSLPFWGTYHLSEWIFGGFMCKVVSSAYLIGYNSSILFLTLMTFDRYLAVVHAVAAAQSRKKLYAIVASVFVWLFSIAASMKEIILRNVTGNPLDGLLCEETGYSQDTMKHWRLVSLYLQFSLFFLIPLFMVMFCYISITVRILHTRMKEKCRTIKLIFIIIFTFFAFWTPYNIVCLLQAIRLSNTDSDATTCEDGDNLDYSFYVTRNIAYLYCGISPVFYTFVGKKFQSHFKRLIGKHLPCVKRRLSLSSQSTKSTSQRHPHTTNQATAFSLV